MLKKRVREWEKPRGCISENRKGNLRAGMQRSLWRLNPPPLRSVQGKMTDFTEPMAGGSPHPSWRQKWQGASCDGWCILCQHIMMENLDSSLQNVLKAGCKEGLHLQQSVGSQCRESLYLNDIWIWIYIGVSCAVTCLCSYIYLSICVYLNFLLCWSLFFLFCNPLLVTAGM